MKRITEQDAKQYIPLKDTFTNDTLQTCELYTLTPSENPLYPKEEGWESITYYTNKKKSDFGFLSDNEYDGWIYILSNPSIPNCYKIGYTDINPYLRAQQISSSTGVVVPFKVEWATQSSNAYKLESLIHKTLSKYRVNNKREFFNIKLEDAINKIQKITNSDF